MGHLYSVSVRIRMYMGSVWQNCMYRGSVYVCVGVYI